MILLDKQEPCRVCGETNSTGFHFGTVTCEACKKFYLRNLNSDKYALKCNRSKTCVITKATRTSCAYCRFKKCIQVGMKSTEKEKEVQDQVSFKDIKCKICEAPSSGLHFGVITCEGCKGFFRRNNEEGPKFICSSNNNCTIMSATRNSCRACRFRKCLLVGMDANYSKIGRQSNLFKEKLKSQMESRKALSLTSLSYAETPNMLMDSQSPFEDTLDLESRNLIIQIFNSYEMFQNTKMMFDGQQIQMFQRADLDYEIPVVYLIAYKQSCHNFLINISFFNKFSVKEREALIHNSIHSLRLLSLTKQLNYSNYFECCPQTYARICQYFPIFDQINPFFSTLSDMIKELKLDNREYALFSAYVAFSSSCKCFENLEVSWESSLEICKALIKYMQSRRNESETSQQLISLSSWFEKLNILLKKNIQDKCKELKSIGFNLDKFCGLDFFCGSLDDQI